MFLLAGLCDFKDIINSRQDRSNGRLFTVLYFSVRSSRSSALRYGLPSCTSVKTTYGAGSVNSV